MLIRILLASAPPAGAAELSGAARVVDGDTIGVAGELVRLWGIDAPERGQLCWLDGEPWACGEAAADALDRLIGSSRLFCIGVHVDRAGLVHAFCRTEHASVNARMVRDGWALDDSRRSGGAYARQQAEAQAARRGLWAGEFDVPWHWRRHIAPALIPVAAWSPRTGSRGMRVHASLLSRWPSAARTPVPSVRPEQTSIGSSSMRNVHVLALLALVAGGSLADQAAAGICQGYGPQTPRDISSKAGTNPRTFALAPPASGMNLCNIHFHANAEHKAPGYSVFAGEGERGGYRCNETASLTAAELEDPAQGHGACRGLAPGDTIEVHWVYTSCDVTPGEGLGSCLSEHCADPQLRVEAQAFLVANAPDALHFMDFAYDRDAANGLHQAKTLPVDTGDPVVFLGSTTGPSYTEETCSPLQVTWSVRPACARLDISSLNRWCADNVFDEDYAHGVRQLVTAPELLARIE